jgi:hypothetical protein
VVVDPVAIGTAITIAGGVFNITTKVIDITKFLKKEDKPYLILDPERNTRRVAIHINNEDRGYKIPYTVYRVYIKNVGQIAAEDCIGYLVQNGDQERVSWNFPENRSSVPIHPGGGRRELEPLAELSFNHDDFNHKNKTNLDERELRNLYHRLQVPALLAPTERGFESPIPRNRIILPGPYQLLVTSITPKTKRLSIPILIG